MRAQMNCSGSNWRHITDGLIARLSAMISLQARRTCVKNCADVGPVDNITTLASDLRTSRNCVYDIRVNTPVEPKPSGVKTHEEGRSSGTLAPRKRRWFVSRETLAVQVRAQILTRHTGQFFELDNSIGRNAGAAPLVDSLRGDAKCLGECASSPGLLDGPLNNGNSHGVKSTTG